MAFASPSAAPSSRISLESASAFSATNPGPLVRPLTRKSRKRLRDPRASPPIYILVTLGRIGVSGDGSGMSLVERMS